MGVSVSEVQSTALPVFPPQLGPDGAFASAAQGSDLEVASAMAVVILWPQGTRQLDEDFGTPEVAFDTGGADLDAIRAALAYGEPRAVETVSQDDGQLAQFVSDVTVGWNATEAQA